MVLPVFYVLSSLETGNPITGLKFISHMIHMYRGTSPIEEHPPPWEPPRTLGIGPR